MKWTKLNNWAITCGSYNIVKAMVNGEARYQIYRLPLELLPGWYPSAELAKAAINQLEQKQDLSA